MDDRELVNLLRERPEEGMEELIRLYSGLLWSVARGGLPAERFSREDVEDVVSDTFAEFYRGLSLYDTEKGCIRGYLAAMTRNNCRDLARKKRELIPLNEAEASGEDMLEGALDRHALVDAVCALDDASREIIVRKFYLGQSSKEIARALKLTQGAVDTRTHRAVARLRDILKERE